MDAVTKLTLSIEELMEREKEKSILLGISEDISASRNRNDLLTVLHERLKKVFYFSRLTVADPSTDDPILQLAASTKEPLILDLDQFVEQPRMPEWVIMNYSCGIREMVIVLLNAGGKQIGLFAILSDKKYQINPKQLRLIQGISCQLSIAIANIVANEKIELQFDEITRYKQQLEIEKLYLQEEIQTTHNYGEIIGSSAGMRKVFQLVSQVSGTVSSVLLMGETGTGKELIARALHNSSARREKLMVKVNCAALPANLIESELFGHERGSFTGATDRRIGKFELANNSTIFLDEVGELPLDLQAKLLRALQEKEIERVGGRTVIKTDVRIIAATNRDLLKEVQAGNFRSDLYYRLNVFPIVIPPLRQRREDIASLATHFLHKHAKKGKGAMGFSSRALKQLTAYNWPGNVRELEHLVERSILLTAGSTISAVHLPVAEREEMRHFLPDAHIKTIAEVEREHIISVLRICNGKVAGIGGAAEKLQIPSTTLTSKIRRLKIRKGYLDE
jgi:formate hydrogenlyase transcriptional activator